MKLNKLKINILFPIWIIIAMVLVGYNVISVWVAFLILLSHFELTVDLSKMLK